MAWQVGNGQCRFEWVPTPSVWAAHMRITFPTIRHATIRTDITGTAPMSNATTEFMVLLCDVMMARTGGWLRSRVYFLVVWFSISCKRAEFPLFQIEESQKQNVTTADRSKEDIKHWYFEFQPCLNCIHTERFTPAIKHFKNFYLLWNCESQPYFAAAKFLMTCAISDKKRKMNIFKYFCEFCRQTRDYADLSAQVL